MLYAVIDFIIVIQLCLVCMCLYCSFCQTKPARENDRKNIPLEMNRFKMDSLEFIEELYF